MAVSAGLRCSWCCHRIHDTCGRFTAGRTVPVRHPLVDTGHLLPPPSATWKRASGPMSRPFARFNKQQGALLCLSLPPVCEHSRAKTLQHSPGPVLAELVVRRRCVDCCVSLMCRSGYQRTAFYPNNILVNASINLLDCDNPNYSTPDYSINAPALPFDISCGSNIFTVRLRPPCPLASGSGTCISRRLQSCLPGHAQLHLPSPDIQHCTQHKRALTVE